MGASLGIQLVAGAGAVAGVQATVASKSAANIQDLSGPSGGLDLSFGAGPAVDVGAQRGTTPNWQRLVGPTTGSVTVGLGVGSKMAVLSMGGTKVWPVTNCGTY
jgi:hypothetical protein